MDVLAVPGSGCAVECQFSISGRMTIWQRNRLSPKIISDSMVYKGALVNIHCPLHGELDNVDDIDILPVDEHVGTVLDEWTQNWWLKNLGKKSILGVDILGMYGLDESEDHDEDIYG